MRLLHPADLPWQDFSSPQRKFEGYSKELSLALGARRNAPTGLGGHPFDLELGRLPSGKSGCPFHAHSAQWELFLIFDGEGTFRHGPDGATRPARPGDLALHPPGNCHQLINTGTTDLTYLLVADNPAVDYWHYPDSRKLGLSSPHLFFRPQPVDYWDGEESPAPAATPPPPAPPMRFAAPAPSAFLSVEDVPWEEQRSPAGRYHSFCRHLSLALGAPRDVGLWGGGHPFDLQIRRVPAGAAICPLHAHTTQWEAFYVLTGTATVRLGDGTRHPVRAADVFVQPPGTAHQILNTGDSDFTVLIVADHPPADLIHYPDSNKWMMKPTRKIVRLTETTYFDGEE